jgi:Domain of unknown function (DUF4249)
MTIFRIEDFHRKRRLILLVILISIYSCIEVFNPALNNNSGLLVVDALITDESRSYDVYLTRSIPNLNSKVTVVKGAVVRIRDDSGNETVLSEVSAGHYITDVNKFTGIVGKRYILYIRTSSGVEYQSDTCKMLGVSLIDQVTFRKSVKNSDNGINDLTGISIFVDGHATSKENCYLRWDFNENWKIVVPFPPEYAFSGSNVFTAIAEKNKYCWRTGKSQGILIYSFQDQDSPVVKDQELYFVVPSTSDRFSVRYSIGVNQYVISQKEFEFWNKLKETNEDVGGMFERQPYSITGNIKNIRDPKEPVLGYFQVASCSSKRLYIDPYQIANLRLPLPSDLCELRTIQIGDAPESYMLTTLSAIYSYVILHDSVLVRPYYNDFGVLRGMIITSRQCADCTVSGDAKKPSFWID